MPSRNTYGGDGAGLYYYAVLQSRTVPGFRWVLDIPEVTGGVSMSVAGDFFAPKNRVRGDAFARAWVARHPGTLVWEILGDDDTGEYTSNTLEVSYYVRIDQVTSAAGQALRTRFAYDPKRRTWTERP